MTALLRLYARPGVAIWLGVLVALPALGMGWLIDDHMHAAAARGVSTFIPGGLDLFNFADGTPERHAYQIAHGLPWWTTPDLALRFWRPLSSAFLLLGYRYAFDWPVILHAWSLLLYAVTIAAVWRLLARTLGERVGALAATLYAVDDGHGWVAGWIANQNALVSAAPALWGTVAWLRWRQDRWQPGRIWAWLGWTVALTGGETALGALALPLTYELLGGPTEPPRLTWKRLQRLTIPALLVLGYLVAYKAAGYGVRNSAGYVDPLGEWQVFLPAVVARLPQLAGAALFRLPVELAIARPHADLPLTIIGLAMTLLVVAALAAVWPTLAETTRRSLRWLMIGCGLSTVPACATFAAARLLIVPSIAAAAVIAVLAAHVLPVAARAVQQGVQQSPLWVRGVASTGLVIHAALCPLAMAGGTWLVGRAAHRFDTVAASPLLDPSAGKTVIFPLAPDLIAAWYPVARMVRGLPAPADWVPLCLARTDVRLTTVDDHTVRLETLQVPMVTTIAEGLVRAARMRFAPGDRVQLATGAITVAAVDGDGHPTAIDLRLDRPLRDPQHLWLRQEDTTLYPLDIPAVGQSTLLKRHPGVLGW